MDDLISRRAALDAVEKNACHTQRIMDAVNNLPPAQPEPKEGYWIGSDGSYICSECNGDPLDFIDTMGASYDAYVETLMKFCPNCGTKMIISK